MSKKIPYYELRADEIRATAKKYGYKITWKLDHHLLKVTIKYDRSFVPMLIDVGNIRRFSPSFWLRPYYKKVTLEHANKTRAIYIVLDMWELLRG